MTIDPPLKLPKTPAQCTALSAKRDAVLDTAIKRLEPKGAWISGALYQVIDGQQSFCLIGAVLGPAKSEKADYERPPKGTELEPANLAVTAIAQSIKNGTRDYGSAYGFTHGGIFHWNDDVASGKRTILAALKRAKAQPISTASKLIIEKEGLEP